jgi:hypothetical protein
MKINHLKLSGSNYEIGRTVGEWWAKYFLDNKQADKLKRYYFRFLENNWEEKHAPLLRNTIKYYPEIIEEIAGMEKGVATVFKNWKEKYKVSFLDVFCLCLGDTDDEEYNCSSVISKTPDGYFLAHNEEDECQYPLLIADVKCKLTKGVKRFISISHPFQLLGSVAGMNSFLAFSGNSIGCLSQEKTLRDTWDYRIPKTVFLRKLLEARTIKDVKDILSSHHSTLPYNYNVVFKDKAYSVQVRPILDITDYRNPKEQITINKISNDPELQTNRFNLRNGKFDKKWTYKKKDISNSIERLIYLKKQIITNIDSTVSIDRVKDVLLKMAKKYKKRTSASLLFEISNKKSFFEGHFYFGKPPKSSGGAEPPKGFKEYIYN